MQPDGRSPVVLEDVAGISLTRCKAQRADGVPGLVLKDVTDFTLADCPGFADTHRQKVEAGSF